MCESLDDFEYYPALTGGIYDYKNMMNILNKIKYITDDDKAKIYYRKIYQDIYDDYTVNYINNIRFNVPLNSFMECSDIPMLCMSNINMINTVLIKKNYYFLESNSGAMKEHIKSSALYDMIETN